MATNVKGIKVMQGVIQILVLSQVCLRVTRLDSLDTDNKELFCTKASIAIV